MNELTKEILNENRILDASWLTRLYTSLECSTALVDEAVIHALGMLDKDMQKKVNDARNVILDTAERIYGMVKEIMGDE